MKAFEFYMPAHMYCGKDCILENKEAFRSLGQKALIVTGRKSAKENGAQADIVTALESVGRQWILFDEIEENPSVETVVRAGEIGKAENVDFVIGIGGGSPMDAAPTPYSLTLSPLLIALPLNRQSKRLRNEKVKPVI